MQTTQVKNSPQMASLDQMRSLHLTGMAEHYQAVLSMAAHQQPDSMVLLAQLLEAEALHRNHRRTQAAIKNARFRYQASVEEILCSQERNLSKEALSVLADGSYIDRGENIIISGATGCGKSFLASALGYQACMQGRKVAYFSLPKLLQQLKSDKLDGSFRKDMERIEKMNLLILDDWGLTPLDTQARLALLQIIEDRHNRHATIITSQLPISSWHAYINENTIADAILDRIIHKAQRIELLGESLRKNTSKKQF
jgi:DNA replication protein DnaC